MTNNVRFNVKMSTLDDYITSLAPIHEQENFDELIQLALVLSKAQDNDYEHQTVSVSLDMFDQVLGWMYD